MCDGWGRAERERGDRGKEVAPGVNKQVQLRLWKVGCTVAHSRYTICKRVIGVEGDVVEIEPTRTVHGSKSWAEGRFLRVPKGHIWIVGDNLSNSTDSRDYGPVPIAMVKGKVTRRVSAWWFVFEDHSVITGSARRWLLGRFVWFRRWRGVKAEKQATLVAD